MKTIITLMLAGLIGATGLQMAVAESAVGTAAEDVGMLEVSVQVDGLSCPFCAYGLEKRLRKVENVAKLEIQVNEGRAVVKPEPGTSVDLAELEQAVRDLSLTVQGRLAELDGAPALELSNGILLLLAEDVQTTALLESQGAKGGEGAGPVVRVQGKAARQKAEGHAHHPYTLTIRTFEFV